MTRPRRGAFTRCRWRNWARWPTAAANWPRPAAYGGRGNEIVTFNVDRNVNYTNVCNVYCKFCAFYRVEKDADSYVISLAEMDQKIAETLALGGTQILMQGGHHPKLTKQWYLDLLSHIKSKWPQINIHGFSPSEFVHFREVFNEPLEKIIADFKAAGLGSIPGGGGEILVDRVRQRIAAAQGHEQRLAGGHGHGAPARVVFLGHDDVRPRGDGGGPHRASGAAARAAGEIAQAESGKRKSETGPTGVAPGPFHRVHRLDVSGRAHQVEGAHRGRA